jgi:hypothetical protein
MNTPASPVHPNPTAANTRLWMALVQAEPQLLSVEPRILVMALATLRRRLKITGKLFSPPQV